MAHIICGTATCPLRSYNHKSLSSDSRHCDHVDITSGRIPGPCPWLFLLDTCNRIWTLLPLGTGRGAYRPGQKATDTPDIPGRRHSSVIGPVRQVSARSLRSCNWQPWCLSPKLATLSYCQAHRPHLLAVVWYVCITSPFACSG